QPAASVLGVLPLSPCQTKTNTRIPTASAPLTTLPSASRSSADGALAPGCHMLETITPSNPASWETLISEAAPAGSACLNASSTVATSSGWPKRVGGAVVPIIVPPQNENQITSTAAAAPSIARTGPFHLTRAHLSGLVGPLAASTLGSRGQTARRPAQTAAGEARCLHLPLQPPTR